MLLHVAAVSGRQHALDGSIFASYLFAGPLSVSLKQDAVSSLFVPVIIMLAGRVERKTRAKLLTP